MKLIGITLTLLLCENFCIADSLLKTKNKLLVQNVIGTEIKKDDDKKNNFDWNNLLSAILGGVIGLSPSIFNYFKKTKIKGKIISQYSCLASLPENKTGTLVLQKVSIFTENNNFFLKDLEVYVKYSAWPEIKCTTWTWRKVTFTFNENGINVQKQLNIDKKDYLLHYTVLPKEQAIVGYISFSLDSTLDEKFEYVRYIFKNYKNNVKELKISKSEINTSTQIYDDSIWI
jgi:hypothetical protein